MAIKQERMLALLSVIAWQEEKLVLLRKTLAYARKASIEEGMAMLQHLETLLLMPQDLSDTLAFERAHYNLYGKINLKKRKQAARRKTWEEQGPTFLEEVKAQENQRRLEAQGVTTPPLIVPETETLADLPEEAALAYQEFQKLEKTKEALSVRVPTPDVFHSAARPAPSAAGTERFIQPSQEEDEALLEDAASEEDKAEYARQAAFLEKNQQFSSSTNADKFLDPSKLS